MRTLGVDLAAADERTAGCVVDWADDGGRVVDLQQPLDDATLIELARGVDLVAIDAPFGWPAAFVDAVSAHAAGVAWPRASSLDLRFRATDLHIQRETSIWPLSVSTDRIGIVAFRAARLLTMLRPGDRSRDGSSGVIEVYPAAALKRWGLLSRGYKLPENAGERAAILSGLEARGHLEVGTFASTLTATSDRLDALVAALVARASAVGMTDPIGAEHAELARIEGWIHLPIREAAAS